MSHRQPNHHVCKTTWRYTTRKTFNSYFIKVKKISALSYMGYEVETINVDSQESAPLFGLVINLYGSCYVPKRHTTGKGCKLRSCWLDGRVYPWAGRHWDFCWDTNRIQDSGGCAISTSPCTCSRLSRCVPKNVCTVIDVRSYGATRLVSVALPSALSRGSPGAFII